MVISSPLTPLLLSPTGDRNISMKLWMMSIIYICLYQFFTDLVRVALELLQGLRTHQLVVTISTLPLDSFPTLHNLSPPLVNPVLGKTTVHMIRTQQHLAHYDTD